MQKGMSALPPIATVKADAREVRCPLHPRKRTGAAQLAMSAKGQKRTLQNYSITSSARAMSLTIGA